MGVPFFFKKILDSERKYNKKILSEKIEQPIENLYIDGNCAIHPQCFEIADSMIDIEDINLKEDCMIEQIIKYFDHIENYVNPTKTVFLAIDGVAPMAKINQQRKRRIKSLVDNNLKNEIKKKYNKKISNWSNHVISPGTKFMEKLHIKLINHYKNKNINITYIYSSYHTHGEGEHKILQDIKKNKRDKSVIYGLDADLIFLTLVSNISNLYLLRESSTFRNKQNNNIGLDNFIYVSIDNVKKIINCQIQDRISFFSEFNTKINHINDYIFICFLIGNDFLPHPPSIDLRKEGLDMIIDSYVLSYIKTKKKLIKIKDNTIIINNYMFMEIIKILGSKEYDYFTITYPRYMAKNKKCFDKSEYDIDIWKLDNLININIDDNVQLGIGRSSDWKTRYYENYFYTSDEFEINRIIELYLEGLKWVSEYYFNKCTNWKWFYPYDHIPFMSDIYKYIKNKSFCIDNINIKKSNPIDILTQLLIILPVQYSYTLPKSYKQLLKGSILDMFPSEVKLDYLYKDMLWQCEPKLPIIDINRIANEIKKIEISSNSNIRNQNLDNFIFK